mmetsp:Transcript_56188/g.135764  ORF Transcript_56188/g.135764 Transcript_56188/m.135764 type:complete len:332 (-) Transcript_56188:124-1119(-)
MARRERHRRRVERRRAPTAGAWSRRQLIDELAHGDLLHRGDRRAAAHLVALRRLHEALRARLLQAADLLLLGRGVGGAPARHGCEDARGGGDAGDGDAHGDGVDTRVAVVGRDDAARVQSRLRGNARLSRRLLLGCVRLDHGDGVVLAVALVGSGHFRDRFDRVRHAHRGLAVHGRDRHRDAQAGREVLRVREHVAAPLNLGVGHRREGVGDAGRLGLVLGGDDELHVDAQHGGVAIAQAPALLGHRQLRDGRDADRGRVHAGSLGDRGGEARLHVGCHVLALQAAEHEAGGDKRVAQRALERRHRRLTAAGGARRAQEARPHEREAHAGV